MMKTRIRTLPAGGQEIFRLITFEELGTSPSDDPAGNEERIVWLEDVSGMSSVRVCQVHSAPNRSGPLQIGNEVRVLGWSDLTADAPLNEGSNGYCRRVFYLPLSGLATGASSAIDPRTIMPGVRGQRVDEVRVDSAARDWAADHTHFGALFFSLGWNYVICCE